MDSHPSASAASIESAIRLSPNALAEALTECFQGYVADIRCTPDIVAFMLRTQAIDLDASMVARAGERFVAVILIGRRDRSSRIAAMAIAPAFRRKGHGRRLLDRVIEDALLRGDKLLVLETIETNEAALKLYVAAGFQLTRRLVGFRGICHDSPAERLVEAPLTEVAAAVRRHVADQASWPMSAATVEHFASPDRGVRVGEAWAALNPPSTSEDAVVVRSLAFPAGGAWMSKFFAAVAAEYPGAPFRMPPLFPETVFAAAALEAGLELDPITQLQLEMRLT